MAINKVVFGNDTLMDITDTTATSSGILSGLGAYGADGEWINGTLTEVFPGDATPLMDGVAAAGSSLNYAREDHVHPHDSTIPSNISQLNNDSGFITESAIPSNVSAFNNDAGYMTGMTILSYGSSTWQDFITAYNAKKVVYCRASSNSNPATGSQTRLAFMAYVSNADSPTNVEFQYYRSVSSHSDSQQGDQMYVYKLTSAGVWSVTVRESYTKIVAGTGLTSTYANSAITLNVTPELPAVASADDGKVLRVVNGTWTAAELSSATGVSF